MRNLSFQSPVRNIFAYDPCDGLESPAYHKARSILVKAMDARLDFLTPAEERVLDDFYSWVVQLRGSDAFQQPKNGAFTYFNCNNGANCIFVASFGYGDYAIQGVWSLY